MQRAIRDLLFIVLGLLVSTGLLWAARGDTASRLPGDVAYLNAIGRTPAQARAMEKLMLERFHIATARISTLRADGMGEGDVAAALATAARLAGGISDGTLARVLRQWKALRSTGWTAIVKALGVSAERVALEVERVRPPTAAAATTRAAGLHKVSVPGLPVGGTGP